MKKVNQVKFNLPDSIDINHIEQFLNRENPSIDRDEYERQLKERQENHLKSITQRAKSWRPCLHDQCSECHGTGLTAFGGICIHSISCPCPKCSPTF